MVLHGKKSVRPSKEANKVIVLLQEHYQSKTPWAKKLGVTTPKRGSISTSTSMSPSSRSSSRGSQSITSTDENSSNPNDHQHRIVYDDDDRTRKGCIQRQRLLYQRSYSFEEDEDRLNLFSSVSMSSEELELNQQEQNNKDVVDAELQFLGPDATTTMTKKEKTVMLPIKKKSMMTMTMTTTMEETTKELDDDDDDDDDYKSPSMYQHRSNRTDILNAPLSPHRPRSIGCRNEREDRLGDDSSTRTVDPSSDNLLTKSTRSDIVSFSSSSSWCLPTSMRWFPNLCG